MKILHVIDSGGLYGAEVMLLNLVAEQIKLRLSPTIISIGEKTICEKPLEEEATSRGFRVKKFRMMPGPNVLGIWKMLRFAHQENFDVMHSHGYKGNILFGFLPRSIRKIPLISTLHGWTTIDGFSKMRLYEWLDSKSLRFIDAVVLVNKAMKSNPKLKKRKGMNLYVVNNGIPTPGPETSTQVNPNPIQLGQSTQFLDQTIIDFCKKGFTIGSIGRLSAEKGYRYLIEALELLVKGGINARLVIIGEGYERDYLERLVAQFGLPDRVMLPGYRDNAREYIPYFNAFAISSLTEGLPITLLEAMQAKLPIVATEVGGIPDVLKNGCAGLLTQPGKPDALGEAISHIYHDVKLANERANIAYQRVATHYASKTMALRYLDIYSELIKNSSRPILSN